MKYLFVLLFLVSCNNKEEPKLIESSTNSEYDLEKAEDKENNVVCYRFKYNEGISCIKKENNGKSN